MPKNRTVLEYQQRCYREYAQSVGLPKVYTYPDGNPIRPLPPIKIAIGGLMIVGAYPSARFESRPSRNSPGQYRLIPVADNLQPFGYEQYFDGLRVRTLESADGLQEYLLTEIDRTPEQSWITDLVKVFLYKPEHTDSCGDVCPDFQVPELRGQFKDLAQRSLAWVQEECALCKPQLIVTLGEEVAQVVSGELSASADELLTRDVQSPARLGYPTLYLPHPDACRRFEKWREQMTKRVNRVKELLES